MFALIKRDILIARPWEYSIFAIVIGFAQLFISLDIIFCFTFLTVTITLFFYDDYYKTNRFVRSLPIRTKKIIWSRYCSAIILTGIILCWLMVSMYLLNGFGLSVALYSFKDMIILFLFAIMILSIIMPFYYLCSSFNLASVFVLIVITITGIILSNQVIEKRIEKTGEITYYISGSFMSSIASTIDNLTTMTLTLTVFCIIVLASLSQYIAVFFFKKRDFS